MRRIGWAVLSIVFTACVAHEKSGDAAAAAGNWRFAYEQYGEALQGEPDSATLRAKRDRARTEALTQASQQASACAARAQWSCALSESEFGLSLEAANPELASI